MVASFSSFPRFARLHSRPYSTFRWSPPCGSQVTRRGIHRFDFRSTHLSTFLFRTPQKGHPFFPYSSLSRQDLSTHADSFTVPKPIPGRQVQQIPKCANSISFTSPADTMFAILSNTVTSPVTIRIISASALGTTETHGSETPTVTCVKNSRPRHNKYP